MIKKKNLIAICRFPIILMICLLCLNQGFSQSIVEITSIDPVSGPPGTNVRITGSGFSSAGNTVIFRSTEQSAYFDMSEGLLPDGQSIVFAVPTILSLACHYVEIHPICTAPNLITPPGVYDVYIGTIDTVDSNVLTFTVSTNTGDVNGNNVIDIIDALLIAQHYVGLNPANLTYLNSADVNCDNATDIVDSLLVAQYYVGMITEFPGCGITPTLTPTPTCTSCAMVVSGYITDTSGDPIRGATIALYSNIPPEAATDASGYYEFTIQTTQGSLCPVTDLSLYITAQGFQPLTRPIVSNCGSIIYDFSLAFE